MAEVFSAHPPNWALPCRRWFSTNCGSFASPRSFRIAINGIPSLKWNALREELKCRGRNSCFFADGRKQVFVLFTLRFTVPALAVSCSCLF
ncbi:hypothetical protein KSP40_PGU003306 [Platanthera guangdongensis]|uniref:Uncharacterized protein n=1 Tax=Platanthera guangdongensis TaxID=2320717 RepID=A0ABR2LJL1_9ASPA